MVEKVTKWYNIMRRSHDPLLLMCREFLLTMILTLLTNIRVIFYHNSIIGMPDCSQDLRNERYLDL